MNLTETCKLNKQFDIRVSSITLATKLQSLELATILEQLNYWLNSSSEKVGRVIDGKRWIFNSYSTWLEQFPWMSIWRVRRAFEQLRELGLVIFAQHDKHKFQRKGWYTIDYEKLKSLISESIDTIASRRGEESHLSTCCLSSPHIETKISLKEFPTTKTDVVEKIKSEQPFSQQEEKPNSRSLEERKAEALAYIEKVETNLSIARMAALEKLPADVTPKKQEILHSFIKLGIKATQHFLSLLTSNSDETLENALLATKAQARSRGFDRGVQAFAQAAIRNRYQIDRPQPGESELLHPQSGNFSKEFLTWYEENKNNADIVPFDLKLLQIGYDREPRIAIKVPNQLIKAPHTWISWREYQKK